MLYLRKLKIILLFSYIFIIILSCYRLNKTSNITLPKESYTGLVIEIKEKDNYIAYTIKGKNKIIAYDYKKKYKNISLGQTITVYGNFKEPESNRNFYLFNYKKYLKSKNISFLVTIKNIKIENKNISILYKIKNGFIKYLNSFKTKEYMLLFLYGENTLEEDIYNQYKTLGIVHLFAISGMHISIFIFIFKKLIKRDSIRNILLFLFLTFYLFLTKSSPGIQRAISCENIAILTKYKISKKKILIFVFFMMIFINPYIIYNIGFQLSFLLSATLGNIKRLKNKNYLKNLFVTSNVAFIVSIPIINNMNFEINVLTPIYNLIFIPMITFIIFPTILITFLIPPCELILQFEISTLEYLTKFFSTNISLILSFPYFNIIVCILFYLFLIFTSKKKIYFILVILLLCFHYFKHDIFKPFKLTLLDVGQGDSILIENNYTILIDTGGEKQKTKAISTIIPSLKARGIHKLDALILTHGDFDHAGSTIELLDNFKVDMVYLNNGKDTELETEIIEYLNKYKIKYQKINSKNIINDLGLILFNFDNSENENEDSLVTYMKIKNYNILLMGDAGEEVENKLIHEYKLPKMDIIKIGHHGSKYSTSSSFINKLEPTYALISVGSNNSYGHPSIDVINRLTSLNTTILKTSTNGSIEIDFEKNLSIRTCLKPATQ
jgi:competence protein ComEC